MKTLKDLWRIDDDEEIGDKHLEHFARKPIWKYEMAYCYGENLFKWDRKAKESVENFHRNDEIIEIITNKNSGMKESPLYKKLWEREDW